MNFLKLNKKKVIFSLSFVGLFVLILSYQNCGDDEKGIFNQNKGKSEIKDTDIMQKGKRSQKNFPHVKK